MRKNRFHKIKKNIAGLTSRLTDRCSSSSVRPMSVRYRIILIITCFILLQHGYAQDGFRYSAKLDSVTIDDFYQVNLQPSLTAQLQPGMADIRLLDAADKQVPYILKSDLPAFKESKFTSFPIVSNKVEADKQVHVVIENTTKRLLNELLLVIKNTDANRMVTLSGSDDNEHWYVIKENIYLDNFFSATGDTFVQALVFPNSSYRYFSIIIMGKNILPVNIVKAGVYEETFINGKYLPLPAASLLQKDSGNKHSYIFIRFNDHHFIDRLELEVKGSRYYKRSMVVYSGTASRPVEEGNFVLSPGVSPVYTISAKTNHLLLKIQNDDNPPLEITGIKAYQLNRYLLTYLGKSSHYQLVWGDSSAIKPSYDLEAFKDSIGSNINAIGYGSIQRDTSVKKEEKESNNKMWIWLSIGAVSVVLLILTYTLTREINKRNK